MSSLFASLCRARGLPLSRFLRFLVKRNTPPIEKTGTSKSISSRTQVGRRKAPPNGVLLLLQSDEQTGISQQAISRSEVGRKKRFLQTNCSSGDVCNEHNVVDVVLWLKKNTFQAQQSSVVPISRMEQGIVNGCWCCRKEWQWGDATNISVKNQRLSRRDVCAPSVLNNATSENADQRLTHESSLCL